ncbi:MAG: CHASE2 domain-containing protein [Coleofasciculaceae cyanobacterium SM2_1_6]|nr:CHASE2 domain-containing protein [Coleofasciculaceae cyanobacterium SM2_1_6]
MKTKRVNLTRLGLRLGGYLSLIFWLIAPTLLTVFNPPAQKWLDRHTQSLFFVLRGRVTPPADIIILAIDDESIGAASVYRDLPAMREYLQPMENFPWQRVTYGRAIEQLMAAGVKSVTLDLLFDLPSGYGEEDDRKFAEVLKKYPDQVVLGAAYDESPSPQGLTITLSKPNPILESSGAKLGFVNYPALEANGRVHQLARNYRQQVINPLGLPELPSLAEATLIAAGETFPDIQKANINYYGSARTFTTLPFSVLAPNKWDAYRDQFRGKIVLIGTTAEILKDFLPTPFSPTMPGVEIHANSIATMMEDRAIVELAPDPLWQGLMVFLQIGTTSLILILGAKRTVDRLFLV